MNNPLTIYTNVKDEEGKCIKKNKRKTKLIKFIFLHLFFLPTDSRHQYYRQRKFSHQDSVENKKVVEENGEAGVRKVSVQPEDTTLEVSKFYCFSNPIMLKLVMSSENTSILIYINGLIHKNTKIF